MLISKHKFQIEIELELRQKAKKKSMTLLISKFGKTQVLHTTIIRCNLNA